jgi:NADPH:quinone reductase-like Zn-dependent oxidoreductase
MEAYILELTTLTTPTVKAGEVLIHTKSIGINPIDIQVRSSKDMLGMITGGIVPEHVILGWDGVTAFKPGDEVYGLVNMSGLGSTYATQVVAQA